MISRNIKLFLLGAATALTPFFAFANGDGVNHAHDEVALQNFQEEKDVADGLVVNLSVTPPFPSVGTTTKLDFFANQKPGGTPISFSALDVSHTKLIHVVGVRSDLEEFFHIHPRPTAEGLFTTDHVFQKPGLYKLWSEVTQGGTGYTFGHPLVDVSGAGVRDEKEISFGRNVVVGDDTTGHYQVFLDTKEPIAKGKPQDFSFDVHTATGNGVLLEAYLGEKMHLIAIKDGFGQFIHGHPEGTNHHTGIIDSRNIVYAHGEEGESVKPEKVNFHLVFPEAGLYKVFVQFRPQGSSLSADAALTAGFWVNIGENVLDPQVQWWVLLLVSLVLMAVLGFVVHRYINKEE